MNADGLADALRRHGLVDVDDSQLARSLYASDAGLYRIPPRVVVRPRDAEEVAATLAVAREAGVPLTMRGAGTSIAGNAIGAGIVVDTSRHLNRVLDLDPDARTARVQPGVVHAALQRRAVPLGLRFGPDPSTHTRCTIGGMIGNNACGSRALGYGRTVDNVEAMTVLLADGRVVRASARGVETVPATGTGGAPTAGSSSIDDLDDLVDRHLDVVRTEFGRFGRQVSGYSFEHLLPENGRRLDRFLVGTEGTLGVVLDATVRLVEDAPFRALAVLGFPTMADAADAVPALLRHPLVACEGLDTRIADMVTGRPDLPAGRGWLFAEVTGATAEEAHARAAEVAATAGVPHRVVTDIHEQLALWRIREDGAGLAARSLTRPAQAGWEDAAVPPAALGAYLRDFDTLLKQYTLDGVPYGHFGDGCVHVRIDFELDDAHGRGRFRGFIEDAADLVASYGGSMSGEHGDGRARSELLPRMYSPEALALMEQAKRILDPENLLNPGVLVDPAPFDTDLRLARPARQLRTTLRLTHDAGSFAGAVHRCTGVGKCIADNTGGGGVMCPSYLATREEKDSTRGRAHVLQDVATGLLDVDSPEVADVLDLCLSCKGCARDCPTGVDMATYKSEVLAQKYARRLRPRSHYALGQLPRWARMTPARVANAMLRSQTVGRIAKAAAGVDERRSLPRFAETPLRPSRWSRRRGTSGLDVTGNQPDVWIWADSFTDRFAADTGRAAIELLGSMGLRAAVIPEKACCGLTWITTGQLTAARRIVGQAVATLHEYVAGGTPVIGLEPSCLAALREDAAQLVDDQRVVEVSAGVRSLAEFLTDRVRAGEWTPPDLAGLEVVAQPHCHHHAVIGWETDAALLAATGAQVTRVGGCCGLAGNFGVEVGHYETSVAVAEHDLLPAVRAAGEDAVVLADGFSCRTQLDDLAGRRALHLAELLLGRHTSRS
jgi:FAD/FMN-containing dehydrogenase/Fe-S oxidoreductase